MTGPIKHLYPCFLLLAMLCTGFSAGAADRVQGISERVFKTLGEAQQRLDEEDLVGARQLLEDALQRKSTDYEQAQMLNMLGYTWYEANELDRARDAYQRALSLPGLPNSMLVTLNLTLGQVYLVDERYAQAESHLRTLLTFEDQDTANHRVLLATALLGQERYAEALTPLQSAIDELEAAGELPRENWLSMLSAIHYELDDMPSMRDVVEQLVLLYPREQYLMNLAAIYGQLGDGERQLALIESLLDDGRLSQPTHLRMVVNLFLGAELPHKAATLLERELNDGRLERNVSNLELLSQAWYVSAETERAVAPLAEAAALSESGDLYLRLARLHMDAARWDQAEAAATAALERGGLRREGQAWLLAGMAEVRLKRFTQARRRFEEAANFDDTAGYAAQWLTYVEAEQSRSSGKSN
jgi:tetratricopeptide (TPR) repeat protein